MNNIKTKLTSSIVDQYDNYFIDNCKVDSFYGKNVYSSLNINTPMYSVFEKYGCLNGTIVNFWEDEKLLTDIFIIGDVDYNNLTNNIRSEEVLFIENLINDQQTLLDTKLNKISSKIMIVKYSTFLNFYSKRRDLEKRNVNNLDNFKYDMFKLFFEIN